MRTKLLKNFCLFSTLAFGAVCANAQLLTSVSVQTADGCQSYTMYNSGKMYFSENQLVIDTVGDGNVVVTDLESIEKLLFSTFQYTSTGLVQMGFDASALAVSPTFATNQIVVTGVVGSFKYQIINVSGSVVATGTADAGEPIDVSSLSEGVYFIRMNGSILKFGKL